MLTKKLDLVFSASWDSANNNRSFNMLPLAFFSRLDNHNQLSNQENKKLLCCEIMRPAVIFPSHHDIKSRKVTQRTLVKFRAILYLTCVIKLRYEGNITVSLQIIATTIDFWKLKQLNWIIAKNFKGIIGGLFLSDFLSHSNLSWFISLKCCIHSVFISSEASHYFERKLSFWLR
jgi:hypothetical protein